MSKRNIGKKRSASKKLRDWCDLDRELSSSGLHIRGFGEEHDLSERQVKHDLDAFTAFGRVTDRDGTCRPGDYVRRFYRGRVRPLFSAN
jgi:hypothetical protein